MADCTLSENRLLHHQCGGLFVILTLGAGIALATPGAAQSHAASSSQNEASPIVIPRLRNALNSASDWNIDVPQMPGRTTFEVKVLAGTALSSEIYLELDAQLKQLLPEIGMNPQEQRTLSRLAELREALATRIVLNQELGYLYAARVYLAMFELAGASESELQHMRDRLEALAKS